MDIAVVTDSTADLPGQIADQYPIHVVRNLIVINGQSLEDGVGISRRDFYRQLPGMKTLPTTGTASSAVYENLYGRLLQGGARYVISLHPSQLLSGVFNAAAAAAGRFPEKVFVIDSGQISMGLGLQVMVAAEAAAQGMELEGVLRLLESVRGRTHLYAMLDTLEYIRRSGRVSWAKARLGNLLRIKPFIELRDGVVYSMGESRTRRKGLERLRQFLYDLGPLERLAVLHTNAEEDARQWLETLDLSLPTPPLVVNVTTVIGTHVGPNALGFTTVLR